MVGAQVAMGMATLLHLLAILPQSSPLHAYCRQPLQPGEPYNDEMYTEDLTTHLLHLRTAVVLALRPQGRELTPTELDWLSVCPVN